jgi:hypothetical protein
LIKERTITKISCGPINPLLFRAQHNFCIFLPDYLFFTIKKKFFMAENDRNQNQERSGTQEQDQNKLQPGQPEQASSQDREEANPQKGEEWSNYRTRELASNPEKSEESSATPPGSEE